MNRYFCLSMDFFRGDQRGSPNSEAAENIDIRPAQAPLSPAKSADIQNEQVESPREEKIELWMKNIKEFIRGIDVKAL